mgnify:CR=1 FL=1
MSDVSPELEVFVNGQPRRVPNGSTVADLLVAMAMKPAQVAVERNKHIVRRADHGATCLEAGDRLEVVTFCGGG